MSIAVPSVQGAPGTSAVDRALRVFGDVRSGEGVTTALMMTNIFLILICYSVIKTVREPLILLGGGAEVRSYAAAGQAAILMGFVPFYGWFASRVDRMKLIVGVTLFFLVNIEIFALAVAAGWPYVGVAFFIWVGIFSISLIAQFWSYANDICSKETGERLFPIIMLGMTLGPPLGSLVAGRLFARELPPQSIIQISAVLLFTTLLLYLWINARESRKTTVKEAPLARGGGFGLVFRSGYLRLVALLIVLLNVVNSTGEYLIARLLTARAEVLAGANPAFNRQAYIGAFTGDYQFWVNVLAFVLQAFVTSRLVKHQGLKGALLVLPFIALGGYAMVAAGASFALVRWIKTAENATDYSIMNTARQLLWLPTSREEKYKAKQAIDTFFMRFGDIVSAAIVFLGTRALLDARGFAIGNVIFIFVWIGVALMILKRHRRLAQRAPGTSAAVVLAVGLLGIAASAAAQDTRASQIAGEQAEKATQLHPYEPSTGERVAMRVQRMLTVTPNGFFPNVGSVYTGGGFALGPGYRRYYGDRALWEVKGLYSIRSYKSVELATHSPGHAQDRLDVFARAGWFDATQVPFYGTGIDSDKDSRANFRMKQSFANAGLRVRPLTSTFVSGSVSYEDFRIENGLGRAPSVLAAHTSASAPGLGANPTYLHTTVSGGIDWRPSAGYARRGGLYAIEYHNYADREGSLDFDRVDGEIVQHMPILRENWVVSLRARVQTTLDDTDPVPYFLLPALGSGSTLRAYSSFRFRDRHSELISIEWRWIPNRLGLDMALFYDAGKVAPRRSDLGLSRLKSNIGIGARFHGPVSTPLRIELTRGSEGLHLVLAAGAAF